jgi:hypothetical protein
MGYWRSHQPAIFWIKAISLKRTGHSKIFFQLLNLAYEKENMVYNDYDWSAKYDKKDLRIYGKPGTTLFTRTDGQQMLYFINRCAGNWGWSHDLNAIQRLERIIREKVPLIISSQIEVYEWIQRNYEQI